MFNFITRYLKLFFADFVYTLTNLTKRQKMKITETSAFGLFINAIYGMSGGVNLRDILVTIVAFYAIIRLYKKELK
ncbi:hypothetical protein A9K75_08570 [Campylobacter fetus subsp. testudinum]|uniref:hypothetical protein n=1 Tax=Campylobacter fetus TaxID=196 RepID=UPI000818A9A9|nr:hypothetical protein [Campylobacter fetus]OCR99055.1 hypothetical protein A9K75_08570 [Campylobacter fetus subsp. testudinum]